MQKDNVYSLQNKYHMLSPSMDERMRRLWAGAEAIDLGRGGITLVSEATGIAHTTIQRGIKELKSQPQKIFEMTPNRIRQAGGGRKRIEETDEQIISTLESLVDPVTRGDPESPLRWTCKSTRHISEELEKLSHPVSPRKVAYLLNEMGYSLQANRKTREGMSHPDRNAQFEYINKQVMQFQQWKEPVISVDTKKKEIIGNFYNSGKEYHKKGCPEEVQVHDFPDPELGKAIPYGVYDISSNEGWVNVGIDHDTAQFAAHSIFLWWQEMGQYRFPRASRIMITANGGGSNSSRSRLWKVALQDLANELQMDLSVCHFPPGTSKWNKIEHRLFSFITKNWRGRPLVSHKAIVNLISNTASKDGLLVKAQLDTNHYETGLKVSDEEMKLVKIKMHKFHGEWNYMVMPNK